MSVLCVVLEKSLARVSIRIFDRVMCMSKTKDIHWNM